MNKHWVIHIFLLLLVGPLCTAQNVLFNNSNGQLVDFNPDGCSHAPILNIGIYTDLASHPDGFLYALSASGRLDRVDLSDGSSQNVATFPGSKYYGLTANAQGEVYAASETGELSSFNPATGQVSLYPKTGYGASGDLTYYKGTLYMATTDNTLVNIDPQNPENNKVLIDFSSSGASIFGIVSTVEDCEIKTYAISGGVSARIYQIDWENLGFNFVCAIPQNVYGGTSTFEYFASENPIVVDSIIIDQRGCELVDNSVTIDARSLNSSTLSYQLNDLATQNNGMYEDLDFGEYIIYLEDDFGCSYQDTFNILPGFLDLEDIRTTPASCGENNGSITIDITTNENAGVSYELLNMAPQSSPIFDNLGPGIYDIVVRNLQGCEETSSINLDSIPSAQIQDVLITNTFCGVANGEIIMNYIDNGQDLSFSINGGAYQSSNTFSTLNSGSYQVATQDNYGCIYKEEVLLENDDTNCEVYIPNSFSPNGDGVNDRFIIYTEFPLSIQDFWIYDRWGNLVFREQGGLTNDPNTGWDGRLDTELVISGTYSYILNIRTNDNVITKTGEVTVIL